MRHERYTAHSSFAFLGRTIAPSLGSDFWDTIVCASIFTSSCFTVIFVHVDPVKKNSLNRSDSFPVRPTAGTIPASGSKAKILYVAHWMLRKRGSMGMVMKRLRKKTKARQWCAETFRSRTRKALNVYTIHLRFTRMSQIKHIHYFEFNLLAEKTWMNWHFKQTPHHRDVFKPVGNLPYIQGNDWKSPLFRLKYF